MHASPLFLCRKFATEPNHNGRFRIVRLAREVRAAVASGSPWRPVSAAMARGHMSHGYCRRVGCIGRCRQCLQPQESPRVMVACNRCWLLCRESHVGMVYSCFRVPGLASGMNSARGQVSLGQGLDIGVGSSGRGVFVCRTRCNVGDEVSRACRRRLRVVRACLEYLENEGLRREDGSKTDSRRGVAKHVLSQLRSGQRSASAEALR